MIRFLTLWLIIGGAIYLALTLFSTAQASIDATLRQAQEVRW